MLNKSAPDEPAPGTQAGATAPVIPGVQAPLGPYGAAVPMPAVAVPSISAFSALSLLRGYNQLLLPPSSADVSQRYRQLIAQNCLGDEYKIPNEATFTLTNHQQAPTLLTPHSLLTYQPVSPLFGTSVPATESPLSPVLGRSLVSSTSPRRQRGEKKPIPDEQKDEKYFERRRRNNQAAKKSRDARKMREDQIAFRATMLEHENAILRAQILTLREEATSLRQMLITKKTDQPQSLCR